MARASRKTFRTVQCYKCRHRFEVGPSAQSTSCPNCHKPVLVGDLVVKTLMGPVKELRTCGSIRVEKRGRIIADQIEAHGGIECLGAIEAKAVSTGGPVSLGAKARFRGTLCAPSLKMKKGARISTSPMTVPEDPIGVQDLKTAKARR